MGRCGRAWARVAVAPWRGPARARQTSLRVRRGSNAQCTRPFSSWGGRDRALRRQWLGVLFAPTIPSAPAPLVLPMSAPDLLDFGGPQQAADDTTFSSEGFHFAAEGVGSGQESGQQPHPAAGTSVSTAPRTPGPGMEPPAVPPARVPPLPGPASGAAPAPRKAQQAATRRREQGRGGAGITGGEHALTAKRRRVEAGSGVGPRGEHLRGSEAAPPSPSNGDPASMARAVAAETHTLDVGAATLESSLREWAERSREQLAALKRT